jgi:hypothetical protein
VLVDMRACAANASPSSASTRAPYALREQAEAHAWRCVLHREAGVRMRKRDPPKRLFAMTVFGGSVRRNLRRAGVLNTAPARSPWCRWRAPRAAAAPPLAVDLDAPRCGLARERDVSASRDTAAMLAAPRRESPAWLCARDRLRSKFSMSRGAATASGRSSRSMPIPSSATANQLDAASGQIDIDLGSPGVEAVFQELLQRGRGTLDDFAGGDLIDELIGKRTDRVHRHARESRRPWQ